MQSFGTIHFFSFPDLASEPNVCLFMSSLEIIWPMPILRATLYLFVCLRAVNTSSRHKNNNISIYLKFGSFLHSFSEQQQQEQQQQHQLVFRRS